MPGRVSAAIRSTAVDNETPGWAGGFRYAVSVATGSHAPGRGCLASSSEAGQYIVDTCLHDAPLGRVGLEVEAHCFDPHHPHRRPGWEEITRVLASIPELPGGSVASVEPVGAVELSGPPTNGAVAAIEATAADQAVLRSAFNSAGPGLVLLGADPLRPAQRVNPGARYRAMEQFFASTGTGAVGAAMMTSTAES